ncbi:hypothetical protein OCOL_000548 [Ordospora colligata]|uniref:Uncharacterized protein n=1 Tax=Ordospora colligata OC4 TaxID=1354746 RepID=A0A0B2UMY5_9MICR|nr:uncharacterized protein M896_010800 [Ordospora colligata OC4]KHN70427.1 hypothetical protein M896_010800 [Ordospora colligata OC4]TBU17177.1 hypothetical protein CWI41_010800 [Ordospora colligata]
MSQASISGKKMVIYGVLFFGMTLVIIIIGYKVFEKQSETAESSNETPRAAQRVRKRVSGESIKPILLDENGDEVRMSLISMNWDDLKAIARAVSHVYKDGKGATEGIKNFMIESKTLRGLSDNMIKVINGLIKRIDSSNTGDGTAVGLLTHGIMMFNDEKMNATINLGESLLMKYQKKMMQRKARK